MGPLSQLLAESFFFFSLNTSTNNLDWVGWPSSNIYNTRNLVRILFPLWLKLFCAKMYAVLITIEKCLLQLRECTLRRSPMSRKLKWFSATSVTILHRRNLLFFCTWDMCMNGSGAANVIGATMHHWKGANWRTTFNMCTKRASNALSVTI
jgi:hypothetical protein